MSTRIDDLLGRMDAIGAGFACDATQEVTAHTAAIIQNGPRSRSKNAYARSRQEKRQQHAMRIPSSPVEEKARAKVSSPMINANKESNSNAGANTGANSTGLFGEPLEDKDEDSFVI